MEKDEENNISSNHSESEEEDVELDSDEELQEALAAGLLKPGLNTILAPKESSRPKTNNIDGLKQKYEELYQKLPWIERLDMVNKPAPLAPELAYQEEQHAKRREKLLKGNKNSVLLADDPVHNDFKREMLFYRQAQATVIESFARLKNMGIPTKRPEDYFAQMMKSDDHMQKIRTVLAKKQDEEERVSKVRKLRELKKFGKQVQVEVQQKRQKEKRDMLEQVKKFRKGKTDKIDFLEDLEATPAKGKKDGPTSKKDLSSKRKFHNEKFGYGGKKRGIKVNTKQSVDDVSGYKSFRNAKGGRQKKSAAGKQKRMGKERRHKMKSKKK